MHNVLSIKPHHKIPFIRRNENSNDCFGPLSLFEMLISYLKGSFSEIVKSYEKRGGQSSLSLLEFAEKLTPDV